MSPPDLAHLALFVAVAEARGFRDAARRLGQSPSSVSGAIAVLEARLGVRLFARTTRSVALTEAGEALLERLKPALAEIGAALEASGAQQGRPSGHLRLTVNRVAVQLLLMRHLAGFAAAFPEIILELQVDDRRIDIVAAGFDAGIRLGEMLEQDMVAVSLGPAQRFVVVGAPDYFQRHPPPVHPLELRHHACIGRRFQNGSLYRWEFEKDGAVLAVDVAGPLIFNDTELAIDAARRGVGLAISYTEQVASDLAAGRLVSVLSDWCPEFPGFYLYYPSRRQMRPALRAWIDYLRGALNEV